jgi:dihydropyrimidine dehydrogenase (NAD+) subunit PreA
VQVCTAIMHYGFRIVEDMLDGLSDYLDAKGFRSVMDLVGKSVPKLQKWETLDLHYQRVARIDYEKCIGCNLCYIACEDGAHQCIDLVAPNGFGLGPGRVPGKPIPQVREVDCVGCNLCALVCPVDGCITMVSLDNGESKLSWNDYQEKLARGQMQPIPPHQ